LRERAAEATERVPSFHRKKKQKADLACIPTPAATYTSTRSQPRDASRARRATWSLDRPP
jgi:hypothetical protein